MSADKTNPSTTPTNTSALLDGYARRLCSARAKIAVVGNILESTQVLMQLLSSAAKTGGTAQVYCNTTS